MSLNGESGGNGEPLGFRRQIELPEVNTEGSDDLAPTSDDRPETETRPAAEDTADSRREDTTAAPEKQEQPALARDIAVATPPNVAVAGDGMPPDRPKKTVLAGVAIGGAVVLAIPILLIGTGTHHHKKQRTVAAAVTVVPDGGQQPGAFSSASPTPTPSPSASAKPKAKHKKAKPEAGKTVAKRHVVAGPPTGPKFATTTRLLLKNVMTGLCADVPGRGNGAPNTEIQQYTCDKSSHENDVWDLVVNDKGGGPHGADLFTIRSSKDSYCFDLPGNGAVDDGTHVAEFNCSPGSGDNQMWYLDKRSTNGFWIRSAVDHRQCLDVLGTDGAGGKKAALTVWPCDPKDDHLWSFH